MYRAAQPAVWLGFFPFTGISEALVNHSKGSKRMYRRGRRTWDRTGRGYSLVRAAGESAHSSEGRGWKGMRHLQGRGAWSEGVLVGGSSWPKTAVTERVPPGCPYPPHVPLPLPCLGFGQPCRRGPDRDGNRSLHFLIWLVFSWSCRTGESVCGKRFVLNVKTNRLNLAFVIVAGSESRDGAMWSQLTVPMTRQAAQI